MRNRRNDLRVPDAEADLYLVGLGIGGFEQRTIEVDQILKTSIAVLHLTAFDKQLREICTGVVDNIEDLYFQDASAKRVYREMTRYVEDTAEKYAGVGHVCFLTYGHPLHLVDSGWQLMEQKEISVKALPATTYQDRLLVDLQQRFDYACQTYEASALLKLKPRLDNRAPLVVPQIGEVNTDRISIAGKRLERLQPIFEIIKKIYPSERAVDLVFSPYRSDMAPVVLREKVANCAALASAVQNGMTLYVHGEECIGG